MTTTIDGITFRDYRRISTGRADRIIIISNSAYYMDDGKRIELGERAKGIDPLQLMHQTSRLKVVPYL